jgi:hypothetical protein
MPKQIDEFRVAVKQHTPDAVPIENGEGVIQVGCFQIVEKDALMVEDIRPAINKNRNLPCVPDEIASPFITVEDALAVAVAVQFG